ncbi:MAG: hypothetical protein AAF090_13605 [Bacteroidota bacterium]
MKIQYLFLPLIFFLACSTNNNDYDDSVNLLAGDFPQRWELKAMSGMVAGVPPTTGEDMDWQEHYLLSSDSTFIKTRKTKDGNLQDSGTFSIINLSDGKYIEFNYQEKSVLVGNCSNEPSEVLRLESETKLVGTWRACDGPGLFYERTE